MAVGYVYAISGCKKTPKEKLACPINKRYDVFISDYAHLDKEWAKIAWFKREAMGLSIAHPKKAKTVYKYNFE